MEDEIIKYQKKLKKWIMKPNWDDIAERLSPSLMSIVTIVMNAKSEKDVSPLVYRNIEMPTSTMIEDKKEELIDEPNMVNPSFVDVNRIENESKDIFVENWFEKWGFDDYYCR